MPLDTGRGDTRGAPRAAPLDAGDFPEQVLEAAPVAASGDLPDLPEIDGLGVDAAADGIPDLPDLAEPLDLPDLGDPPNLPHWPHAAQIIPAGASGGDNFVSGHLAGSAQSPCDRRTCTGGAVGQHLSVAPFNQVTVARDDFRGHGLVGERLADIVQTRRQRGPFHRRRLMAGRYFHVGTVTQHPLNPGLGNRRHVFGRNLRSSKEAGGDLAHIHAQGLGHPLAAVQMLFSEDHGRDFYEPHWRGRFQGVD